MHHLCLIYLIFFTCVDPYLYSENESGSTTLHSRIITSILCSGPTIMLSSAWPSATLRTCWSQVGDFYHFEQLLGLKSSTRGLLYVPVPSRFGWWGHQDLGHWPPQGAPLLPWRACQVLGYCCFSGWTCSTFFPFFYSTPAPKNKKILMVLNKSKFATLKFFLENL